MTYVRYSLSLRNVEDLLHERGTDISHEAVRFLWNRFGPLLLCVLHKFFNSWVVGHFCTLEVFRS